MCNFFVLTALHEINVIGIFEEVARGLGRKMSLCLIIIYNQSINNVLDNKKRLQARDPGTAYKLPSAGTLGTAYKLPLQRRKPGFESISLSAILRIFDLLKNMLNRHRM